MPACCTATQQNDTKLSTTNKNIKLPSISSAYSQPGSSENVNTQQKFNSQKTCQKLQNASLEQR